MLYKFEVLNLNNYHRSFLYEIPFTLELAAKYHGFVIVPIPVAGKNTQLHVNSDNMVGVARRLCFLRLEYGIQTQGIESTVDWNHERAKVQGEVRLELMEKVGLGLDWSL